MKRMPSGRGTGTWRFTEALVNLNGLRSLGPEGTDSRKGSPVNTGKVVNNFSQNSPLLSFKIILALHGFLATIIQALLKDLDLRILLQAGSSGRECRGSGGVVVGGEGGTEY